MSTSRLRDHQPKLQPEAIARFWNPTRSFDYAEYQLSDGMLAFGAEGRAEERIAVPALITSERADWLANNHVMRVLPREGVNVGWLYLAFASWQVQAQVKARSCGSVVDAVYPSDLQEIVLPPADDDRASIVIKAWDDLSSANSLELSAVSELEQLSHVNAASTMSI
jgi:hypothetical protein